jgi:hypothetical protein
MSFVKTKRFDNRNFEKFQNLHPIAHVERAKDGLSIQILKDDKSGDIIFHKGKDFYKLSDQELTCIETINCFFNVEPQDILLSSCVSEKIKRFYKPTQI